MSYKVGGGFGRIGLARTANIQLYCKFDGDMNDSSSNGFNLTKDTGSEEYVPVAPGLQGFYFDGATRLSKSNETALEITGACSMHALLNAESAPSINAYIAAFGSAGAGDANNFLWFMSLKGANRYMRYLHESSGPTLQEDGNEFSKWTLPYGTPTLWSWTRDSAGTTIKQYVNGRFTATYTAGAAPSGGTTSTVVIGDHHSGSFNYKGGLAELQVLNTELTAAQVLEDARKIMPWI